jgi:hypothetical protein
VNKEELIKATGQHLLFLGIETNNWQISQFTQAARFARAHGTDCLLVKVADGGNRWYGSMQGWRNIRQAILHEGVGAIPYTYSYGNKFGALDTEIDYLIAYMQDCGIVCGNFEIEWNNQVGWARHLCQRMQPVPGTFLCSTWANPSIQGWLGVVAAMSPCVNAFMPQQYNNSLAKYWGEFGAHGASFLQPTVCLTNEFGVNDPVAITKNAKNQGHTAISVWHYGTAVQNPRLLDAVFSAFPKTP